MSQDNEIDLGASRFQYEQEEAEVTGQLFPIVDASVRTSEALACLKQSKVDTIIRYYCADPAGSWKVVRPAEAQRIIAHGLRICIVNEVSRKPKYFSYASGKLDADFSCKYGQNIIGQPRGSAIYFAIDFDADEEILHSRIVPYFEGVAESMKAAGSPYKVGVYGSGLTCRTLLKQKLVDFTWLAQSTGWREYDAFKASKHWSLLQKPAGRSCKIEVDFDEALASEFGAFDRLDSRKTPLEDFDVFDEARVSTVLNGLDEDLKVRAVLLIKKCAARKIKMVPYFGLRSPQTQAKLWRQSRNATQIAAGVRKLRDGGAPWLASVLESASAHPDKQVTRALPGMSWHQWGQALDCYREIKGKPDWDDKKYIEYATLAETKEVGLTSGSHFDDWDHLQLKKEAGPQNYYSFARIDADMKARWGGASFDVVSSEREDHGGISNAADTRSTELINGLITVLREAATTQIKIAEDQRPYFFPNGIFEIDLTLGVLSNPPSGGNEAAESTPGLSARIIISGRDKA